MVLLNLLISGGADVLAINLEHGIRGEESVSDTDFVRDYCAKRGIPFETKTIDTLTESREQGMSVELAARKLRYEYFDSLLVGGVVDCIALAHHADDNAETMLMRILRGTGVKGLRGIVDHDGYIHPLITFTKREIVSFAEENGIPFVTDKTNFENNYTRNYIRNVVMRDIAARYENYSEAFNRLSENAKEVEDFMRSSLIPYEIKNGAYTLPIFALQFSHIAVQKYSVANLLSAMGARQDIEYRHLGYILSLLEKANGTRIQMPFGIIVAREYDTLAFYKVEKLRSVREKFLVDGVYTFAEKVYSFVKSGKLVKGCSFDADKVPETAVIRTRQEGDTFKRCNGRSKKLSNFLIDNKVPMRERERLLYLADGSDILAILGVEISDKIKITKETERTYFVKCVKSSGGGKNDL